MEKNIFIKFTAIPQLLIMLFFLFFQAHAESLHLKSGQIINASIIEKTQSYVKIDFYGVPLRYYIDEIDRIEQEPRSRRRSGEEYVKQSTFLLIQANYDEAIDKLTEATNLNINHPGIYHNLGVAYTLRAEYSRAIDNFKKAAQAEKSDFLPVVKYNLATALCLAGLSSQAKELATQIDNTKLSDMLETMFVAKQSNIKAMRLLLASSFPPDTVFFMPQQATPQELSSELEQMNDLGDKLYIIESMPALFLYRSSLSYLNLAISCIAEGQFLKAKGYLGAASGAVSSYDAYSKSIAEAGIHFSEGQIFLEEHNYDEARKSFKKAIEIFPAWRQFHKYLGVTYYLLHNYPKACDEFQMVLHLIPENSDEAVEVADYLRKIEFRKKAVIIKKTPGS